MRARESSDRGAQGSILFSGTATVVIRIAGFTLLTDPNSLHQGDHAPLGCGMTSRRKTEPALSVEQANALPIDAVIPIHYNDYEVFKSPLEDFQAAVKTAGLENRVPYLNRGDTYHFPLEPVPEPETAVTHDVALEQSNVIA